VSISSGKHALKSMSFSKCHHPHYVVVVQKIGVPLDVSFHFFIMESLIPLIAIRWRNECLGFVERENKQEGGRIKKIKRREHVEKEHYIIREEAFRATSTIYIKPLASRLHPIPTFIVISDTKEEKLGWKKDYIS
jgi:hypothetical protein